GWTPLNTGGHSRARTVTSVVTEITQTAELSGCGDHVDVHADVGGDTTQGLPDVAFGAEPQLTPMRESGGEGFGDEQPSGRIAGRDGRGTVEQWPRVE